MELLWAIEEIFRPKGLYSASHSRCHGSNARKAKSSKCRMSRHSCQSSRNAHSQSAFRMPATRAQRPRHSRLARDRRGLPQPAKAHRPWPVSALLPPLAPIAASGTSSGEAVSRASSTSTVSPCSFGAFGGHLGESLGLDSEPLAAMVALEWAAVRLP